MICVSTINIYQVYYHGWYFTVVYNIYLPNLSSMVFINRKGRDLWIRVTTPRECELRDAENTWPSHLLLMRTISDGVKCVSWRKTILDLRREIRLITCFNFTILLRPLTFQDVNNTSDAMRRWWIHHLLLGFGEAAAKGTLE